MSNERDEKDSEHPSLSKIKRDISDIRSLKGIVKEVIVSKATKSQIKEIRKDLSLKCSSQHLGFFSFMIRYIRLQDRESKKITSYYSS